MRAVASTKANAFHRTGALMNSIALPIGCAAALLLTPSLASANLCEKSNLTNRYRSEARLVRGKDFSLSPDYYGDDEYNAWILACNRDRDNRGKELDAEIDPNSGGGFAPDLPNVSIKGQYSYYGNSVGANAFTSLEYRYQLRRESGTWVVTLPIRLSIPGVLYAADTRGDQRQVLSNRLDIPEPLAVQLGVMSVGGIGRKECDRGREKMKVLPGFEPVVDTGYIPAVDAASDGPACRLPKDRVLPGGTKVLNAYYDMWRGSIEAAWNRKGFEIQVLMLDIDAVTESRMKSFERDDQIWTVHAALDPSLRARYRSAFLSVPNLYTGVYPGTIAHESGHELGLDDEYRENDKGGKNAWRDCYDAAAGGIGMSYMMCSSGDYVSNEADSDYRTAPYFITTPSAAKGIYTWIITRRYAVGELEQCFSDADCGSSHYCDAGTLGVGRNQCKADKRENDSCSADHQCASGAICKGKPVGKCITEASVALGAHCEKDAQCISGSCNTQSVCQCKSDGDCGGGHYCDTGTLALGRNVCKAFKSQGESCSSDGQCLAPAECQGKPLGKCIVASSVALGGSCSKDAECNTGSCDNNGICQCTTDAHCGGSAHCSKGTLGIGRNICVSDTPTLALGASCMRDDQCVSDSCSSQGHCQCKRDSDCGSRKCKEPITKENYCD
jgi:hypothetical protein